MAHATAPQGGSSVHGAQAEEPLTMDLTLFNANLGPDQASKAQAAASPLQPQPDEPPPPWSGAQGAVCACGCRGLL